MGRRGKIRDWGGGGKVRDWGGGGKIRDWGGGGKLAPTQVVAQILVHSPKKNIFADF